MELDIESASPAVAPAELDCPPHAERKRINTDKNNNLISEKSLII